MVAVRVTIKVRVGVRVRTRIRIRIRIRIGIRVKVRVRSPTLSQDMVPTLFTTFAVFHYHVAPNLTLPMTPIAMALFSCLLVPHGDVGP